MRHERLPVTHVAVRRCLVGPVLAEFGEKTDEVDEFIFAQGSGQSGGHQRDRADLIARDLGFGEAVFVADGVADDEFVRILAGDRAGDGVPVFQRHEGGVVAFLDLLARFEERIDEVINGGTRADADKVGPDHGTGSADGMAGDTLERDATIDRFALLGIADRRDLLHHSLHLGGGERGLHGLERARFLQCGDESLGT